MVFTEIEGNGNSRSPLRDMTEVAERGGEKVEEEKEEEKGKKRKRKIDFFVVDEQTGGNLGYS